MMIETLRSYIRLGFSRVLTNPKRHDIVGTDEKRRICYLWFLCRNGKPGSVNLPYICRNRWFAVKKTVDINGFRRPCHPAKPLFLKLSHVYFKIVAYSVILSRHWWKIEKSLFSNRCGFITPIFLFLTDVNVRGNEKVKRWMWKIGSFLWKYESAAG